MGARILVVANPQDAERLAGWLREAGLGPVVVGEGSDDTLTEFASEPAPVVVLAASLAAGDALSFAGALRAEGGEASALVLLGDADTDGPVRTPHEAREFGAERFLRHPVTKGALVWAVKSCLDPVAAGNAPAERRRAPTEQDSPEALAARLEEATAMAVAEAAVESLERAVADEGPEPRAGSERGPRAGSDRGPRADSERGPRTASLGPRPDPEPESTPPLREPTQILGARRVPTPPPLTAPALAGKPAPAAVASVAEESRGGTFVSELRKHMSLVEARLFGGEGDQDGGPDEGSVDLDLDAFGTSTQPGIVVEALEVPAIPEPAPAPDPAMLAVALAATPPPTVRRRVDLAEEDVATLFARLHRERFSGHAVFRRADAEKRVALEDGRAVFAASNLSHDRMGELLLREGKISRAQHARAAELAEDAGRRLGEVLVELGQLKRRELLPAVRRHVEDIVYSLFAWEHGTVDFVAGTNTRDEKIRLAAHPSALVVEGIRRKYELARLRRLVGPPSTVIVLGDPAELAVALNDAELATEERKVVEAFDGRRPLADAGEETLVHAVAHALAALGLTRRAAFGRAATEPGGFEVIAPPSTITGAAELEVDRSRVRAKFAHVLDADYFTLLGVRPDASGFEIRRAWEAARRDFAAEGFAPELQRELATELGEIASVLDEALRVLRDDRVRSAYAANLTPARD